MKHTQEQMQQVVDAWKQSGFNKKVFCRQQNIAYATFQYWWKRLNSASESGFSEIKVDAQPSGGHEIVFPSGVRMIIQGEPSVSWLRELVG